MPLPKIIFRRSWLYDNALARNQEFVITDERIMDAHLKKLERAWMKVERVVLKEISRLTKLPWHEKEIVVYFTSGVRAFSDPLTLNPSANIEALTHELIHRIISEPENWKKIEKNWKKLLSHYKSESKTTKSHIFVHAIHGALIKKLFGEVRLRKEKESISLPDYIRAWEIVDEAGYPYIIGALTSGL